MRFSVESFFTTALVKYLISISLDKDNFFQADHLYVRAMAFSDAGSDEHKRALINRQRTQVEPQRRQRQLYQPIPLQTFFLRKGYPLI